MIWIYLFIAIALAIFTMMQLDDWSTRTLLAYKHLNLYNDDIRKKIIEHDKKKGVNRYELNVFARYFFNKFGYSKGSTIFNMIIRYPLILLTFFIAYTSGSYVMLFGFLMFYIGVLFGQIIRAKVVNTFTKQIGVNLKEYSKKMDVAEG